MTIEWVRFGHLLGGDDPCHAEIDLREVVDRALRGERLGLERGGGIGGGNGGGVGGVAGGGGEGSGGDGVGRSGAAISPTRRPLSGALAPSVMTRGRSTHWNPTGNMENPVWWACP